MGENKAAVFILEVRPLMADDITFQNSGRIKDKKQPTGKRTKHRHAALVSGKG